MSHPEVWRLAGVAPQREGPLSEVREWCEQQGWFLRIWKDLALPGDTVIQLWGLPPLIGLVLKKDDGERLGLLYQAKPDYLSKKK